MRAGKLRTLLTLQTRTESRDVTGDSTPVWADTAQVWAHVDDSGGSEFMDGDQTNANRSVLVTTRYRAGITAAHRFKHGTRYYNVVTALNKDARNRMLEIQCKEDA